MRRTSARFHRGVSGGNCSVGAGATSGLVVAKNHAGAARAEVEWDDPRAVGAVRHANVQVFRAFTGGIVGCLGEPAVGVGTFDLCGDRGARARLGGAYAAPAAGRNARCERREGFGATAGLGAARARKMPATRVRKKSGGILGPMGKKFLPRNESMPGYPLAGCFCIRQVWICSHGS